MTVCSLYLRITSARSSIGILHNAKRKRHSTMYAGIACPSMVSLETFTVKILHRSWRTDRYQHGGRGRGADKQTQRLCNGGWSRLLQAHRGKVNVLRRLLPSPLLLHRLLFIPSLLPPDSFLVPRTCLFVCHTVSFSRPFCSNQTNTSLVS